MQLSVQGEISMTDQERKAMEMALEALEWNTTHRDDDNAKRRDAIEALRQALAQNPLDIADRAYFAGKQAGIEETLAQPEQEPAAWMGITDNPYCDDADCNDPNGRAMRWHKKLLYLRKQEYTAPPSKPWVSLTDEERNKLWKDVIGWGDPSHDEEDLMKAIEAALRSKNT